MKYNIKGVRFFFIIQAHVIKERLKKPIAELTKLHYWF